ncbi:CvpA family protein [Apilactobacillus xinyiensis]|uniref:CvpA family protein n=1 Tax=Apilactobacillus xinyiensis TaxID=2841032 RepID=UPI001C7D5150
MILTLLIWVILIFCFIRGYKLGLVQELIILIGYLISWVVSLIYADDLTNLIHIDKITSNHVLSNSISFFIIFIIMFMIVKWVKKFFKIVKVIPLVRNIDALLGSIVSMFMAYMTIFLILNFLLLLNISNFKIQYSKSKTASFIVNKTPILSHELYQKWFQ